MTFHKGHFLLLNLGYIQDIVYKIYSKEDLAQLIDSLLQVKV